MCSRGDFLCHKLFVPIPLLYYTQRKKARRRYGFIPAPPPMIYEIQLFMEKTSDGIKNCNDHNSYIGKYRHPHICDPQCA